LWHAFSDSEDSLVLDLLSARGNKINVQWALRLNFKICSVLKARSLDLGFNHLGDKGVKELQVNFTKNEWLESLDLSQNSLTRMGCRRLKELVRTNK